jgi:hypothetical protein
VSTSNASLPSQLRPTTLEEDWIIEASVQSFLAKGTWPKPQRLVRTAAIAGLDISGTIYSQVTMMHDYLWRSMGDEVQVSLTGFLRDGIQGKQLVENFIRLVALALDAYLVPDDENDPVISEDRVRSAGVAETAEELRSLHYLLRSEYFLTAGGGSTGPDGAGWWYVINDTIARFRGNLGSVDDYLAIRSEIVPRPSPPPPALNEEDRAEGVAWNVAVSDGVVHQRLEELTTAIHRSNLKDQLDQEERDILLAITTLLEQLTQVREPPQSLVGSAVTWLKGTIGQAAAVAGATGIDAVVAHLLRLTGG